MNAGINAAITFLVKNIVITISVGGWGFQLQARLNSGTTLNPDPKP